MSNSAPIGIFDSGVGGLSVWREIATQLPRESTVYVADQAHVPYGPRGEAEIGHYSSAIADYLLKAGCKALVVACNTASATALQMLRDQFPQLPIIGMEPAVKPAVAATRTGVVGVLATPATFQGRLFRATAGRYAEDVTLVTQVGAGLADCVEAGDLDSPQTCALLQRYLQPMLDANADTLVLACSHYPFLLPAIRQLQPQLTVIDPAPAIARHVGRLLTEAHQLQPAGHTPEYQFYSTGKADVLRHGLQQLLGREDPVHPLHWQGRQLLNP